MEGCTTGFSTTCLSRPQKNFHPSHLQGYSGDLVNLKTLPPSFQAAGMVKVMPSGTCESRRWYSPLLCSSIPIIFICELSCWFFHALVYLEFFDEIPSPEHTPVYVRDSVINQIRYTTTTFLIFLTQVHSQKRWNGVFFSLDGTKLNIEKLHFVNSYIF